MLRGFLRILKSDKVVPTIESYECRLYKLQFKIILRSSLFKFGLQILNGGYFYHVTSFANKISCTDVSSTETLEENFTPGVNKQK